MIEDQSKDEFFARFSLQEWSRRRQEGDSRHLADEEVIADEISELKKEIEYWKSRTTPTDADKKIKRDRLRPLRAEMKKLTAIERLLRGDYGAKFVFNCFMADDVKNPFIHESSAIKVPDVQDIYVKYESPDFGRTYQLHATYKTQGPTFRHDAHIENADSMTRPQFKRCVDEAKHVVLKKILSHIAAITPIDND